MVIVWSNKAHRGKIDGQEVQQGKLVVIHGKDRKKPVPLHQ